MKMRRFFAVTVGVMALSVGLVLLAGERVAQAVQVDGVTQNWDKNLPSASRFTVLAAFGNHAVRDNNTGLVWEQAPDATPRIWVNFAGTLGATNYCVNKTVGGTVGWRLPSVVELKSVQDLSLPEPFVPASAFTIAPNATSPGVQSADYWSASTFRGGPAAGDDIAWIVSFASQMPTGSPNLIVNGDVNINGKTNASHAWCVRGGMNADQY